MTHGIEDKVAVITGGKQWAGRGDRPAALSPGRAHGVGCAARRAQRKAAVNGVSGSQTERSEICIEHHHRMILVS
jgi:hypothetical protein